MNKSVLREIYQHTTILVPYKYYPSAVPDLTVFIEPHWHEEFEVNYIRKGTAAFEYRNKTYVAQEGDIFIFRPNQIHAINQIGESRIYYDTLLFKSDMFGGTNERGIRHYISPLVSGLAEIRIPVNAGSPKYEIFREVAETIFSSAKAENGLHDILIKGKLLELFYLLYDNDYIYELEESETDYASLVQPAITYINEHFCEKITVDELAEIISLSKSYFMYCFKKAMGIGAVSYLTQIRVKNVCNQLLNTDKTVMEIALESGFNNLSNFNKIFKKKMGVSPNEYRSLFSKDSIK